MRLHEIENWALSIVDRVKAGQRIEDTRVELKSEWIEPSKAARQIAGHANASRGAPILWLIGLDEKRGITGAQHEELANWYAQVKAQFDGLAPELIDLNVPVDGQTIVALFFRTERIPFVVKNPDGGHIQREVPWREGTSTRSATRSDLLRLLSPLQQLPNFEMRDGYLSVSSIPKSDRVRWYFHLNLYAEIIAQTTVIIPFHRCRATFEINGCLNQKEFNSVKLTPRSEPYNRGPLSRTIESSEDEVLIHGPGNVVLSARVESSGLNDECVNNAVVDITLQPVNAEHPVRINLTLTRSDKRASGELHKWTYKN